MQIEDVPTHVLLAEIAQRTDRARRLEAKLQNECREPKWVSTLFFVIALVAISLFVGTVVMPNEWMEHPLFIITFALSFAITLIGGQVRDSIKMGKVKKLMMTEHRDAALLIYRR